MLNFFLFKSKDQVTNANNIRLLKTTCYLLSSLGLAWGLFLVSKNESNMFFGMVFSSPVMVIATSIVSNLIWAVFCTYMIMFFTSNIVEASQTNVEINPRDSEVFRKISEVSNQYNEAIKSASNAEKKHLIEKFIGNLHDYSNELSESKINNNFKKLMQDRIKKLQKEASKL